MSLKEDALEYASRGRAGKIEVVPTKSCKTQAELSLAYSPGVAHACMAIVDTPTDVMKYTAKGNLVAVVTNGTAVLGLGNIGPEAGKPVMEGKGILFKRFADIDVFDIELNAPKAEDVINTCLMMEPTFGGINLEDIKAPECFEIEETLIKKMGIPVFHDDQHGTAIIAGAAILSYLEIRAKKAADVKVVINGAGAAGISIAKHLVKLGLTKANITMVDTKGVIYKGRTDGMNKYKEDLAVDTPNRTLAEAAKGADILMGLSTKGAFTNEIVLGLAPNPMILAMANPDPEINYNEAKALRADLIMGTGRSDYPNQVNNVLCFPFLFRGALDTHSVVINDEMKIAASRALHNLTKEPVPASVSAAYDGRSFEYGMDYIIPTPFDPRNLVYVSKAVAKAAMDSGSAKKKLDLDAYEKELIARMERITKLLDR